MTSTKQVWAVDAETDPFEVGLIVEPFIWGVYHHYNVKPFYKEFTGTGKDFVCTSNDIENIVDFLSEQNVICYAHNGGKFDWHFLSEFFEPTDDILVINGRLSRFKIGKCEFRDSWDIIPRGLAAFKKDDFKYWKMSRKLRHKYMSEIRKYLESDCVNLWDMVREFEKEYGRNITQASAAMNYWRGRLKKKNGEKIRNEIHRSTPSYYDYFKPYYFGGRTQCFDSGDIKINAESIDIRSAYPFAMLSKHPYGLLYSEIDGKPRHDYKNWGPMFFEIYCTARGCFPYNGNSGKRYYPSDDIPRYYNVTGWELIAAIDTDTVSDIEFVKHFQWGELKDFKRYVNHFYALRKKFPKDTHPGTNMLNKLFMNSLYGKFCADPRTYKRYMLKRAEDYAEFAGQPEYVVKLFREWCLVGEPQDETTTGFYNIATGASITGFVRAMLWRSICAAKHPMYCDTDSITAESFGSEVIIGTELGEWESEAKYDRVVIAGRKLYAMHYRGEKVNDVSAWKKACKGADLNYKEIIRAAHGEKVTFNNKAPTFSMLRKEPTFVSRVITNTVEDITTVPADDDPKYSD